MHAGCFIYPNLIQTAFPVPLLFSFLPLTTDYRSRWDFQAGFGDKVRSQATKQKPSKENGNEEGGRLVALPFLSLAAFVPRGKLVLYGKYGLCTPRNRPRVPPRGNKTAKNDKTLETTTTSKKARHQVVLSTLFDIRSHFFPPVQLISCSIREGHPHAYTHMYMYSISISIQEKSLLIIVRDMNTFSSSSPLFVPLLSLLYIHARSLRPLCHIPAVQRYAWSCGIGPQSLYTTLHQLPYLTPRQVRYET